MPDYVVEIAQYIVISNTKHPWHQPANLIQLQH